MLENDLNIIARVAVIVILAGFLGWERESAGKAAGIRTHILVGIGAVLFVALGEIFVQKYQHHDVNMRFDPIRIIEAVVTGISFLGAGTIFVSRGRHDHVQGLTTAASILTTAAIGMTVGLERYVLAVACTFIIFFVLRIVYLIEMPKLPVQEKDDSKE
jgi:putative Mg2+ transporter-C (MgtC) family protein